MVTQDRLKELFSYDENTGDFTRIKGVKKGAAGTKAGVVNKRLGYVLIGVDRGRYYAHRLAFLYMIGEIPDQVDHIDRDRSNNKWSNLRGADNSKNGANKVSQNMLRGMAKGVGQLKSGKWRARIKVNKKEIHLGVYPNQSLASDAYKQAAISFFGGFALTGDE